MNEQQQKFMDTIHDLFGVSHGKYDSEIDHLLVVYENEEAAMAHAHIERLMKKIKKLEGKK